MMLKLAIYRHASSNNIHSLKSSGHHHQMAAGVRQLLDKWVLFMLLAKCGGYGLKEQQDSMNITGQETNSTDTGGKLTSVSI